mmetsp:Transcript_59910/g.106562  ORF Transcript_59910/g.106562 Transcript_59910/m.106562 type:complete len:184 (-) Transcript_59910:17-568(-)
MIRTVAAPTTPAHDVIPTEAGNSVKFFTEYHRYMTSRQQDLQWMRDLHTRKSRLRKEEVQLCTRSLDQDKEERIAQILRLSDDMRRITDRKTDTLQSELVEREVRARNSASTMSQLDKKKVQFQLDRLSKEMDAMWGSFCMVADAMQKMAVNLNAGMEKQVVASMTVSAKKEIEEIMDRRAES